jgi:RHS repeat-associated protein
MDMSTPVRYYLTSYADPLGNAVTLQYDQLFRITAIVDAIKQVTSLSYNDPVSNLRITDITDPFQRSAHVTYDTSGNVHSIQDVIGMTSTFYYEPLTNVGPGYMYKMTTPYGTTLFDLGEVGPTAPPVGAYRWAEITDPMNLVERIEFRHDNGGSVTGIPFSDPPSTVPPDFASGNTYQYYRNTFVWDKLAYENVNRPPSQPSDFAAAHIYHWLHEGAGTNNTSGLLESEKPALENRIWYGYQGESSLGSLYADGITCFEPCLIERNLDGTHIQIKKRSYVVQASAAGDSATGNLGQSVDPIGRTTTYTYDLNQIDLVKVQQSSSSSPQSQDTIATYTGWNSQHRPQTMTDAANQTTQFSYNAQGQLKTVTDALLNVWTLIYDPNGYLKTIQYPTNDQIQLTYDSFGRVQTVTGTDGYTVTYDYDALDRLTKRTYPDQTYEQFTYTLLDLTTVRDRLGNTSTLVYDNNRKLTDFYDRLNRHSHFTWCPTCGALKGLTDGNDNLTAFDQDVEGRLKTKTYPDMKVITYNYEPTTNRLHVLTDAAGQTRTYTYNTDDTLASLAYGNVQNTDHLSAGTLSYEFDPVYLRLTKATSPECILAYVYYSAGTMGAGRVALTIATDNQPSSSGNLNQTEEVSSYDALGRLTSLATGEKLILLNVPKGFPNVMLVGDGFDTQTFTYDALSRLLTIDGPLGHFGTFTYDGATDRLATEPFPNGMTLSCNYDGDMGDHRLLERQYTTAAPHHHGRVQPLARFNYTSYDSIGRVLGMSQDFLGATTTDQAGYDAEGQLTSFASTPPQTPGQFLNGTTDYSFSYDNAANLVGQGESFGFFLKLSTTYSCNMNNQVWATQVNSVNAPVSNFIHWNSMTYDPNGNLTNESSNVQFEQIESSRVTTPIRTYEWDEANHLRRIYYGETFNGNYTDFHYDALGRVRRVTEFTNSAQVGSVPEVEYFWRGNTIAVETISSTNWARRRFFDDGVQSRVGFGPMTNHFYTRDQLGSIYQLVDQSRKVQSSFSYDPYGSSSESSNADPDYGFAGYFQHHRSGLDLTLNRFYSPNLRRWISRDPLPGAELSQGPNLYTYVANDPVDLVDPLGFGPNTYSGGWGGGKTPNAGGGVFSAGGPWAVTVAFFTGLGTGGLAILAAADLLALWLLYRAITGPIDNPWRWNTDRPPPAPSAPPPCGDDGGA